MSEYYFGPGKEMNGWTWDEWIIFEERLSKLPESDLLLLCERHGVKFDQGDAPIEHVAGALLEATRKEDLVVEVKEIEGKTS